MMSLSNKNDKAYSKMHQINDIKRPKYVWKHVKIFHIICHPTFTIRYYFCYLSLLTDIIFTGKVIALQEASQSRPKLTTKAVAQRGSIK